MLIYILKKILIVIIFLSNNIICSNYNVPIFLSNGLDSTSLYGSNIISNDMFIFVSANGYNIFNGAVICYYKNFIPEKNDTLQIHSIIYFPEISNSNFGVRINVYKDILIISAIAHNIYTGIVYVYNLCFDNWILVQKLEPINYIPYKFPIGFGYDITINEKYLAIGCTSNHIYIYKFVQTLNKYQMIGNIIGQERSFFGNKITLMDNILFTSLNEFIHPNLNPNKNPIIYDYFGIIYGYNLEFFTDKIHNITNNFIIHNYAHYDYIIQPPKNINCKYFGTNIKILNGMLITSCSVPYPFYNFNIDNFEPKLITYLIKFDKTTNKIELNLVQIIIPTESDIYFGTNFDYNTLNLFVSGTNKIYHYKINNGSYIYNQSEYIYVMPDNFVNNDYKVNIASKIVIVGSYGSNDLSGSIYYLKYNNSINLVNSGDSGDSNDTDTKINNILSEKINKNKNPVVFILTLCALIILTFMMIILIVSYVYYMSRYAYSNSYLSDKKKKKEEEEYSPYTVHSYLGYSEIDDYVDNTQNPPYPNPNPKPIQYAKPIQYPNSNSNQNPYQYQYQYPNINQYQYPNINQYQYPNPNPNPNPNQFIQNGQIIYPIQNTEKINLDNINKEDKIIYKKDNIEHIISKETVYSYKEYENDIQNQTQNHSEITIEKIKNQYKSKYKALLDKIKESKSE